MSHRTFSSKRRAFTLVELLVVIGIIAVLIAVLLPVLNRVKRQADTVYCLANLRQFGVGLQLYVNEFRGALPGSGATSGRHFFKATFANSTSDRTYSASGTTVPPGPVAPNDWIYPVGRELKLTQIDVPNDKRTIAERYQNYRKIKLLFCAAESGMDSTAYTTGGGQFAPPGPILGYVTALAFLQVPNKLIRPGVWAGNTTDYLMVGSPNVYWALPPSYAPQITKIGDTSSKIFMADGRKFTSDTVNFSFNLDPYPDPNGSYSGCSSNYADYGAFTYSTLAYDRKKINRDPRSGPIDGRVDSFRHGTQVEMEPLGRYALNALFYDGSARTLNEREAVLPRYWLPRGSVVAKFTIPPDVANLMNVSWPYTTP